MRSGLYRILDANGNRAREGLRVAEELVRLGSPRPSLQARLQRLRHAVARLEERWQSQGALQTRDTRNDPGRCGRGANRDRREPVIQLCRANFRRTQEALRVLEELCKLTDPPAAPRCQRLRFQAYALEQATVSWLQSAASLRPRKQVRA